MCYGVGGGKGRCGKCLGGVGSVRGVWGIGSRCVEVCLGCGERCGKGVGVGKKKVGGAGKCWEKGETIRGSGKVWCPNLGSQLS